MNDIEGMLNSATQHYYGNEYLTFQKNIIEKNGVLLADRLMIEAFIYELHIRGNIIDLGSGNCQWFPFFENTVNHYFAIDANSIALSLIPPNSKLTSINVNIFDQTFELSKLLKDKIDVALFSFFLSHFSDQSIYELLTKLSNVNCIIIIDSLWSIRHKEKYQTKELGEILRKTSETEYIKLPKRFFELSDITKFANDFGYSVIKSRSGKYWFISVLQKNSSKL